VPINKEYLYISNLLSVLRIVLLIPLSWLMLTEFDTKNNLIIILVLCMYLSDLLDGYLARKLNEVSEFGKIIDPLADKICVIAIAVILVYLDRLPLWFVSVVVLRDITILIFGVYLKRKKDITLMSNYPGKIAVFCIGLVLLFSIIDSESLKMISTIMYFVSILMIAYSSHLYLKRYLETVRKPV